MSGTVLGTEAVPEQGDKMVPCWSYILRGRQSRNKYKNWIYECYLNYEGNENGITVENRGDG